MYGEIRVVIAEDAAQAQAASRFQVGEQNPRLHGVGNFPTPSNQAEQTPPAEAVQTLLEAAGQALPGVGGQALGAGPKRKYRSSQQAADIVGGASYKTLDKVNNMIAFAKNDARSAQARHQVGRMLTGIDGGKPVDPAYKVTKALATLDDLVKIAENQELTAESRHSAIEAINVIEKSKHSLTPEVVDHLVKPVLNRVDRFEKTNQNKTKNQRETPAGKVKSPKEFTYTWEKLADWPSQYNVTEIATTVPEDKWRQFEQTMRDAIEFTEAVNQHRTKADVKEPAG